MKGLILNEAPITGMMRCVFDTSSRHVFTSFPFVVSNTPIVITLVLDYNWMSLNYFVHHIIIFILDIIYTTILFPNGLLDLLQSHKICVIEL